MVCDKFKGRLEFYGTDYLGVLKAVRDKIHLGHSLLTHPLSGSVKPWETPYKTVIVTDEKGALNDAAFAEVFAKDIAIIEESIQTCIKFGAQASKKEWDERTLADFQLIDYNLISTGSNT
jgi:hypothetical protein